MKNSDQLLLRLSVYLLSSQLQHEVWFLGRSRCQRQTMNDLDDYLYDRLRGQKVLPLTTKEMDRVISGSIELARHRMSQ